MKKLICVHLSLFGFIFFLEKVKKKSLNFFFKIFYEMRCRVKVDIFKKIKKKIEKIQNKLELDLSLLAIMDLFFVVRGLIFARNDGSNI